MLTVRIEPDILDYTRHGPSTVGEIFGEAASHIPELRPIVKHGSLSDELVSQMAMMVFGSNNIERVGSGLSETVYLCRKVLLSDGLSDLSPRSPEYYQCLEAHIRSDAKDEQKIRERREVINHAMAFMYLVQHIIQEDKPFSEEILKQAHAILCTDIPVVTGANEVIPSDIYAGTYRTRHVAAGNTNFVTPTRVGEAMTRFVSELNDHLLHAERIRKIDPFFTAAHACGEFVMVHPFLDGNGRTCRLILNTILLKHAGVVCPIGRNDVERKEYLDIAKRRSAEECGNGELAWYVLQRSLSFLKRLRNEIKN